MEHLSVNLETVIRGDGCNHIIERKNPISNWTNIKCLTIKNGAWVKMKSNYNEYVEPYLDRFISISITEDRLKEIENFVNLVLSEKAKEDDHQRDFKKEFKRWRNGFCGEAAVEAYLGINFMDFSIGESTKYCNADLKSLGLNIGIKTSEYGQYPLVHKNPKRSEIIVLKKDTLNFLICGLATIEVLKEYQSDDFILDANRKKLNKEIEKEGRSGKSGFYGFGFLQSIRPLRDEFLQSIRPVRAKIRGNGPSVCLPTNNTNCKEEDSDMVRRKTEKKKEENIVDSTDDWSTTAPEENSVVPEIDTVTTDTPIGTITDEIVTIVNKETELQTSNYASIVLTKDELDNANELKKDFAKFLKEEFKIEPGDSIKYTIPFGIDILDAIMGGGAGSGLIQIIGPTGTGKSALAAKILSTAQKKYRGVFLSPYIDSEQTMTEARLYQLGVGAPSSRPYNKDITVEKVFKIIEGICGYKMGNAEAAKNPSVIVWDSIANTLTDAGMAAESMNSVLGEKARALSFLLPKYVDKLNEFGIALVAINQLRDKLDMGIFKTPNDLKGLNDKNVPGGKALIFNSMQIIHVKTVGDIKGEYGFNGTKVQVKLIKNKLFTPFIDIELIFSFERGFSNFWTNFELLKKFKRIQSGAWCILSQYPSKKFRQYQAIELYNTDPEFRQIYNSEVQDVIKKEYLDVYNSTDISKVEA